MATPSNRPPCVTHRPILPRIPHDDPAVLPRQPTPSGSHLADPRGDFAAWITIDGELCRAYEGVSQQVPHPGGPKMVIKCVMGVQVGKVG